MAASWRSSRNWRCSSCLPPTSAIGADNVLLLNAGAGSATRWISMPEFDMDKPGNYGAMRLGPCVVDSQTRISATPIPVHRLDDLPVAGAANVIKINVELMELQVLEGASRLISRRRPALFVENEHPGPLSEAILEFLNVRDYDAYWQVAPCFDPNNFGNSVNVFGNIACVNILGLPRERGVAVNGLRKAEDITEHPREFRHLAGAVIIPALYVAADVAARSICYLVEVPHSSIASSRLRATSNRMSLYRVSYQVRTRCARRRFV